MPFWLDSSSDNVTRLKLTNRDTGKVMPTNCLIYGSSGSGKSFSGEEIVNMYFRNGWTVISISDVKDGLEFGFSMFEAEARYHIQKAQKFGCPLNKIPAIIYHPFTDNIPKGKLPDINFFTIPVKNLTSIDLKFLAESQENKRSIQIIMESAKKLKRDEGLHHLVFKAEGETESLTNLGKNAIKFRSDDADVFFTKVKLGTEKTSTEIVSYMRPFNEDYALAPENCPINLDIVKIMNDNKHYHIFNYSWIKERRMKAFFILHILQEIINNSEYAKHPICIYLEEVLFLTPNTSDGFSVFLAEELKNTFITFRNKGRDFATIMTTQSYRGTSEKIIDSCNDILLGRISSLKEIDFISKSLKLSSTETNLLKSLQVGEFAVKTVDEFSDEPTLQKVVFYMPPHSHKDSGYKFIEFYERFYPEKMKNYDTLKQQMSDLKQADIEKVTLLKDKENAIKKESQKKTKEERLEKDKMRMKIELAKINKGKEKSDEITENMRQMIFDEYMNAKTKEEKNLGVIANKFKLFLSSGESNKMLISRIIRKKMREQQENGENNRN